MEFAIGSDGRIRGVLNGRQYVGPQMAGGAADDAYHVLQEALDDVGYTAAAMLGDAKGAFLCRARIFRRPAIRAAIRAMLGEFSVGGVLLAKTTDWDDVYRGRPEEPTTAAVLIWEVQGFFRLPGTMREPEKPAAEKPAAEPAPAV